MNKAKQPGQQSSFLDKVETKPEPRPKVKEPEPGELEPIKVKPVIEHLTSPKIIHNPHSLYCPDCKSKLILRPDGATVCPNCTIEVPVAKSQRKAE